MILQSSRQKGDAISLANGALPVAMYVALSCSQTAWDPMAIILAPCWQLLANTQLQACTSKCHSEMLHRAVKCLEACPRPLKGCDHLCPHCCGDPCPMKCQLQLRELNVTLACGHARDSLPCWQAQDPSRVVCRDIVTRVVPGCGHQVPVPCFVDVTEQSFQCEARCAAALECGRHTCQQPCNACKRREDGLIVSENHPDCPQICARTYKTCSHRCRAICHGETDCPPCQAPCEVSCCHSKCTRLCSMPCTPCAEETCPSICPHSRCNLPCAAPCDWLPCSKRCAKLLECGHQCPSVCGELCPPSRYCQICAPEDVKNMVVDLLLMEEYHEVDLDANPCMIPACGHILTMESMDGQM